MRVINWIALLLVVIGAINWGLVGFFKIDAITKVFSEPVARIIFGIIGLAGLWSITFFKHFACCDYKCDTKNDNNKRK
jgi:uncharacterized membrane protein YuzA (DUF378 family)